MEASFTTEIMVSWDKELRFMSIMKLIAHHRKGLVGRFSIFAYHS